MKILRNILDKIEPHFLGNGKYHKLYPLYEMADTFLFTPSDKTKNGPHVRDAIDIKRVMSFVVIAMLPALLFGIYNIGRQIDSSGDIFTTFLAGLPVVLPIILVSYTVGGFWEMLFAVTRKHEINEGFLVTGMLIPLVMPPTIPLWMVAVATSFGVVIGKEIFGGTGYNIFNPALVARAFIFFAYPGAISGDAVWAIAKNREGFIDGISQATPLLQASAEQGVQALELIKGQFSWWDMFYGFIPGSIGETSTLAIIIGGLFLLFTGIGNWRIMAGTLLGMVLTAKLTNIFAVAVSSENPMLYLPAEYHFVMGGFAFGMVFMATDPVSASQTDKGRWMYGILIGFMCVIIRSINPAYPEGMMLAILFANAFAPLIDYFVMKSHIKQRVKRFAA
ncbi:MAG: NADH:ubiquinone reductase (Na(+)-transporting) subunit B [Candidatus Marinimicrobia bacterium]|jgi:Na+-transporting NADH:ubiquinone oxidoreductase subunit B|nr:NADH:ubiquinone reductase (Na(+)-transporting) subunit B [Candidatus Neomarinimicrobiota bacterium]MDP6852331.1 NADH:ubiquinone reductase (Na(+)-transporting) subunit B [Candidatus Neomarinimicrobiota bacterium]